MNIYRNKIKTSAENLLQAANSLLNNMNMHNDMPETIAPYKTKAEELMGEIERYEASLEAILALEALKPYLHEASYELLLQELSCHFHQESR